MEKKFYFKQTKSGLLDEFGDRMTTDLTVLESELTEPQMNLLRGELTKVYNQMPSKVQSWFKDLLLVQDPEMFSEIDTLCLPKEIAEMIKEEI